MNINNVLIIEKTVRGNFIINLRVVKKIILYALRDITERFFITKIDCEVLEPELLHVYVSGKVLKNDNLSTLTHEIHDLILKECMYSLKLKPKNINVLFHK